MDKSRQQFEEWRSKNKSSTINLFDVWQASRESLINNLEPVAWMYPVFHDDKMQFTTDAVTSENIDIHFQSHGSPFKIMPLYRLDK
ncbi:hypothetical protein GKR48_06495 [Providencia sp. wls1943]|uniref:hypothetical protein n=1 Tax=Providencia sp. wls1943 TaxID=2675150 RepID=UPI0012B6221D|nr:hypothetical protein [Providencia sp. wls1943]MTB66471.1 hypothetical protein [Providencia sp. wls1943]